MDKCARNKYGATLRQKETRFYSYWIQIWLLFPCIDYLKAVLSHENKTLSFNCLQCLIDVKIFRLIKLHSVCSPVSKRLRKLKSLLSSIA